MTSRLPYQVARVPSAILMTTSNPDHVVCAETTRQGIPSNMPIKLPHLSSWVRLSPVSGVIDTGISIYIYTKQSWYPPHWYSCNYSLQFYSYVSRIYMVTGWNSKAKISRQTWCNGFWMPMADSSRQMARQCSWFMASTQSVCYQLLSCAKTW